MPTKAPPKTFHILVKTHKLTIFITTSPTTTIASLKTETLSALKSDVNQVENVPKVTDEGDFEISRALRERGKNTVQYELLEGSQTMKDTFTTGWEVLFLQFRDSSGNLLPVEVTQPTIFDEDEEPQRARPTSVPLPGESSSVNKGKRKAPPE